ncbi:DMT family transporter [Neisseria leonii]|uniref:DMT family transporter n=1 Tax=Neisseria leonii TaxID=2995413 RepID=UPI00237B001B|nr:DMT family transporter [Neisseria sp. 3986]MDD9326130.1 DMT family transporter [Neisseria sp. 3986]
MPAFSPTRHAAPLLVTGCILFGLGSLIVKFSSVGPYALSMWRLLTAGLIFACLTRFFGHKLPENRRAVWWSLLAGVFLAFDLALWAESIHAVGPGISTLLNSLQIFFLTAFGFFLFGEQPGRRQSAAMAAAVAGVVLIAAPEFGNNSAAAWGFASGTASGAMLAASMLAVRKAHQAETVALFPMMLLISLGGVVSLILPALLFDRHALYPTSAADTGLVLVYGAVMQCLAWGMIAYTVPLLPLSLTGLLLLTEPAAALLIDAFWLGKTVEPMQWCGVWITLAAVYLGSPRSPSPGHASAS